MTQVGQPFSFNNTADETLYTSLAHGDYYFEVQGTSALAGSGYDFEAYGEERRSAGIGRAGTRQRRPDAGRPRHDGFHRAPPQAASVSRAGCARS